MVFGLNKTSLQIWFVDEKIIMFDTTSYHWVLVYDLNIQMGRKINALLNDSINMREKKKSWGKINVGFFFYIFNLPGENSVKITYIYVSIYLSP